MVVDKVTCMMGPCGTWGLCSVGTCFERSCLHGTGTVQCWDML